MRALFFLKFFVKAVQFVHLLRLLSRGQQIRSPRKEVTNVKHNLKISVSKEATKESVVSCRNVTVRERFLRFLLGDKQKLTIIVPGNTVSELAIAEIKEGGQIHE